MKPRPKKFLFWGWILAMIAIILFCWLRIYQDYKQTMDSQPSPLQQQVMEAIADVDPSMKIQLSTQEEPVTLTNAAGDTIVCHGLTTTCYNGYIRDIIGIDLEAIKLIIDPSTADSRRDCFVNDLEALLLQKGSRAFLCWTESPEYSCVIEYTPGAVAEEEIFIMAEDLNNLSKAF